MIEHNKVLFTEKIHFDRSQPFGSASKGSDKLEGSVVPGEHGKAHFESRFSATKEFRPSCKIIPHMDRCPEDVVIPKRGPQLHTLKFTSYNPYRDRRHLTDKDLTRIDSSLISNGKKIVMMDDRHQRSQFRSSEGSMETTFNRKQRVDIDSRRNGVGVAHAGDKSYKTPEHAPGYFKDGGLISGSSIRPRPERGLKSCEQTDTASKSIRSLTAHEKREIDTFESDRRQVEILTKSHFKRGQEMPSWEERTGMWLCEPEDDEE